MRYQSFSPSFALLFGVTEAIVIDIIARASEWMEATDTAVHEEDGIKYFAVTDRVREKICPYISYDKWMRTIKRLEDLHLIRTYHGKAAGVNHRKLYAIGDDRIRKEYNLESLVPLGETEQWAEEEVPEPVVTEKTVQIPDGLMEIVEYWEAKGLAKIRNHTPSGLGKHITRFSAIIKEGFTVEDAKHAIDVYHWALTSDESFFKHRWTLLEFIQRENGMRAFADKNNEDYMSKSVKHTTQNPLTAIAPRWELTDVDKMSDEEYRNKYAEFVDVANGMIEEIHSYYERLPESRFIGEKIGEVAKFMRAVARGSDPDKRIKNFVTYLQMFMDVNYARVGGYYYPTQDDIV